MVRHHGLIHYHDVVHHCHRAAVNAVAAPHMLLFLVLGEELGHPPGGLLDHTQIITEDFMHDPI